jgi:3-oxoacyl-[acyl-carrier protein] reductase
MFSRHRRTGGRLLNTVRMIGRAVLVTGASRGIGAATARAFASAGDRVAVHYRSSVASAKQTLESMDGQGHVLVPADLADPDATQAMVDQAAAALGGIDVVVNNAGVYMPHAILDVSYEEWQQAWSQTFSVNLFGAANVTWCAVRHMPAGGKVVNVASRGAFRGEPGQPAMEPARRPWCPWANHWRALSGHGRSRSRRSLQVGLRPTWLPPP